jgi:hypothetical protein
MNTDSNQKSEKTLIVVLGMHRSGTSVLARAMGTLGGELGERLMPPVVGVNDKGFFEDVDVNAINVELLKAAGADWYSMMPIDLDCIGASLLDRLQTKAITVLREKCAGTDTFVLKDPRLTRLLPFWRPVFACLNLRVVYVVAVRNPISVARSLARVHHFAEEKSYILWLAHLVPALEDTRDQERIFVDYDLLMDAPARELSRVSEATGLPQRAEGLEEFEREFLEDGLRNSRFSANDLDVVRSAPRQVKSVFIAMQRAAVAEIAAHGPELDSAAQEGRRYLDSIAPLLRYEWRLVRHVEEVTPALTDANARMQVLELALRDSEARAASEIAARNQVVLGLERAVAEGRRMIREHVNHLEASQRYANDLKGQAEQSSVALEALESKAATQEAALRRAGEDIAQVFGSTSWRITAPLRALRRMGSSRNR